MGEIPQIALGSAEDRPMMVFLKCAAEAVMENGISGLLEMVPGGKYLHDIATGAWKKYRERKKDAEIRADIHQLAAASFEEARRAAAHVAKEVAAKAPVEERIQLEIYLAQVPGTVRQSLKRREDRTEKTVPKGFALDSPEAVLKFLPGTHRGSNRGIGSRDSTAGNWSNRSARAGSARCGSRVTGPSRPCPERSSSSTANMPATCSTRAVSSGG